MKIKATQIKTWEKDMIVHALLRIAEHMEAKYGEPYKDTRALAIRIKHGEIIICEYTYTEPTREEGTSWN